MSRTTVLSVLVLGFLVSGIFVARGIQRGTLFIR